MAFDIHGNKDHQTLMIWLSLMNNTHLIQAVAFWGRFGPIYESYSTRVALKNLPKSDTRQWHTPLNHESYK